MENIKGNAGFVKEKVRPIEPRLEGLRGRPGVLLFMGLQRVRHD